MAARALFVGGTNGIGYAMACRVAAELAPSTVVISGRTKPADLPHANMDFRRVDASSMREIKKFTDKFKSTQKQEKLDLLVMSQGIMTMSGRTETAEGIDQRMAIHYYGKQLFVKDLLPVLKDDARIIIVYDSLYGGPSKLDWDDLDLKKNFGLKKSADHCTSMTDAMLQTYALQQKQNGGSSKRHFVHAWPGGVATNLLRDLPWYVRLPGKLVAGLVAVSPDTCAQNLLRGIPETSEADEADGRFYSYCNHKGKAISKKEPWTEEQLKKVEDHTWCLIDQALALEDSQ